MISKARQRGAQKAAVMDAQHLAFRTARSTPSFPLLAHARFPILSRRYAKCAASVDQADISYFWNTAVAAVPALLLGKIATRQSGQPTWVAGGIASR